MPITLGQPADSGFDEPIDLMRDCHRRIEKFLDVLIRVVDERRAAPLSGEHRAALEAALRYFKNAAPWHTRDEEDSLFPRMRLLDDVRVRQALARIDALESDHQVADAHHAEVDRLGRAWLENGRLNEAESDRLRQLLSELRETYRRHIAEEDDVIFPLAAETLPVDQITEIGREMAARRGLDPADHRPRCRHARQNQPQL